MTQKTLDPIEKTPHAFKKENCAIILMLEILFVVR